MCIWKCLSISSALLSKHTVVFDLIIENNQLNKHESTMTTTISFRQPYDEVWAFVRLDAAP